MSAEFQWCEHEVGPYRPRIRLRQSNWSDDAFDVVEWSKFLKCVEGLQHLPSAKMTYIGDDPDLENHPDLKAIQS